MIVSNYPGEWQGTFCWPVRPRRWLVVALAAGVFAGAIPAVPAQDVDPAEDSQAVLPNEKIHVQTGGHGAPELIFLSDRAAPPSVWDHVVARFEVAYRCHVVWPTDSDKVSTQSALGLDAMADAVIAYVREEHLAQPVLIGYGGGGVLALTIALKVPDLPGRLVLINCLPCPAAAGLVRHVQARIHTPEPAVESTQEAHQFDFPMACQTAADFLAADLRPVLGKIRCRTLVLGTLAGPGAVAPRVYRRQYRNLPGVRFAFFGRSGHCLMTDDLDGFTDALRHELSGRR